MSYDINNDWDDIDVCPNYFHEEKDFCDCCGGNLDLNGHCTNDCEMLLDYELD